MEKMKTLLWICVAVVACVACGRQKTGTSVAPPPPPVASVADTVVEEGDSDTRFFSPVEENFFSGEDGIFEEFLYEFAGDTLLQMHRIHFPLPYINNKGEEHLLSEQDWPSSRLLCLTDIYHTLFEHDAEMDAERDTSMAKVDLECVDMQTGMVRTFRFEKQKGYWQLCKIVEQELASYRHREFYAFYHRFVTDSLYQSRHVNDPMTFVTVDPEDDFNIIEANIDMEQWFAFHPLSPEQLMINVDYGVKSTLRPKRKILTCKSLGGNFNTTSYFRRIDGEWMLTRFEDMSN